MAKSCCALDRLLLTPKVGAPSILQVLTGVETIFPTVSRVLLIHLDSSRLQEVTTLPCFQVRKLTSPTALRIHFGVNVSPAMVVDNL